MKALFQFLCAMFVVAMLFNFAVPFLLGTLALFVAMVVLTAVIAAFKRPATNKVYRLK